MEIIKVRIKGAALLMHNIRLANPMDEGTKRMKALTSVRKKTDDMLNDIADVEFECGLYIDPSIGPFIPGLWMDAAIIEGGKLQKNGSKIRRSAMVLEDQIRLNYEGPRDLASLMKDPRFRDVRAVTVGQAKTMRCRPKFTDWSAEFTLQYDPQSVNRSELEAAIHAAGQCIGIGDFRPRFGRFEAEVAA